MQRVDESAERQLLQWQADRMEAVGMLARGIAHDFNNILSGILGFASYWRNKAEPGTEWHRDLGFIEEAGKQAAKLTQKLFLMARRRHGARGPVDMAVVVNAAVETVRWEQGSAPVRFAVEAAPDVVPAWGDAKHLQTALENLLRRCVSGIGEKPGEIRIRFESRPLTSTEETILINVGSPMYVCLTIADTGRAMSEEMRMHLFDPFYLSRTSRGGSGLDLPIAYGIIANHLGNVVVENGPNGGTITRVYLPVFEQAVRDRVPEDRLLGGSETILVVDNEHMVREMVSWVLEAKGYHVIATASGEEALNVFRRENSQIDLILLDILMTGMGGEEAFFALRAINPKSAILLTSVREQEDLAERLISQGACDILYKPYKGNELLYAIRRALSGVRTGRKA